MSRTSNLVALAGACMLTVAQARAQCLEWRSFPVAGPDLTGMVRAVEVFDDGSGPALFCGGQLMLRTSAVETISCKLVKWDGSTFQVVSLSDVGNITLLYAMTDATGPALYATNTSSQVLKYQSGQWQVLGTVSDVAAMTAHDDGSGMALYLGGHFIFANAVQARGVAKWNGSSWEALAGGPGNSTMYPDVSALASFDDGTGPALYAGGTFNNPSSPNWRNIARWKSGAWSPVGGGADDRVRALATVDFGSGPALYAGGDFYGTPGMHLARWNGSSWSAVSGIQDSPGRMRVIHVGGAEQLYVAAGYQPSTGFPNLLVGDGQGWTHRITGFTAGCNQDHPDIRSFAQFDDGTGSHVFAATSRGTFDLPQSGLARENGGIWERVGAPPHGIYSNSVRALEAFDDGSGPALYVGGELCWDDEQHIGGVLRWDGAAWHAVDPSFGPVYAFAVYTEGGTSLVATNGPIVSRLVNSQWVQIGFVLGSNDQFLTLHQFGSYLYAGGSYTSPTLGVNSPNISRWSPSTGFVPIGSGSQAGANSQVNALTTFDDGHGAALYAGGTFTSANGVALAHIGRFDGTNWTPLGIGTNSLVDALAVYDDGTGAALYAAGTFTAAGGVQASCVAKWNGTSWSAVGAGLNAQVLALEVFDDGSGPALYAGGNFSASGSVPMSRIARWNGATWSAVGGDVDGTVWTLKSFDDGTGPGAQLFAGGVFQHAGALPSQNLAAWRGCGSTTITKFCFGDGSDGACPCGHVGLSSRGCDNSVATGGARLNATGTTSPDTIVLHAAGELPNAPTLVFQGSTSLSQPVLFGDGLRCVGGNLKRLFTTNAAGGALDVPGAAQMSISARSAALGDPLVPGSVRSYQAWYRDPNLSFCGPPSGDAWNLSNAVRIVW